MDKRIFDLSKIINQKIFKMKKLLIFCVSFSLLIHSYSQTAKKITTKPVKRTSAVQPILIGMNQPLVKMEALKRTTLPLLRVNSPSVQRIVPVSGSGASATNKISRTPIRDSKVPASTTKLRDELGRYCTESLVSEQNGDYEKIVLGNQSDKILPGAIYYDNAVMDGSYNAPTNLQLKPYGITSSMFSAASSGSAVVQVQPTLGEIKNGVAELMRRNTRVLNAAMVHIQASNIYSAEQLSFFLQADYQGYGVDLNAEFDYNRRQKKNLIFVKLKQVYFSVSLNRPSGADLLTNNPSSIPSNLVYVNKVNYGRIGILKIESDSTVESIRAALDFSYNGGSSTVGVGARVGYERVLASSKVEGFFFGGDAADAFPVSSAADLPRFNEYVRNGLRLNPDVAPVPISYELKYLNDNATASINSVTEYTERNCESAKDVEITLRGITIEDIHGGDCSYAWGSIKVEVWELDDRGIQIPNGMVKPVENGVELNPNTALMWNMPDGRNPQRGMANYGTIRGGQNTDINNIRKKWRFRLDPEKVKTNSILIVVKCDINTNHKDNDIAALGFHGMKRVETQSFRINDVIATSQNLRTDPNKKYGSMIVGPYTSYSGSDRNHNFRAHFDVMPAQ
jgi:Thiol-activated cytolysin